MSHPPSVDRSRAVRVLSLLVMAGAAVALVAGCSQPANVTVQAPTVGGTGQPSGVIVSGKGEVSGAPDTLTITFGVALRRDSVEAAVGDNAAIATKVQDALKAKSVDPKDIRTSNYSLSPAFDYEQGKQVPKGFQVSNNVVVKVRELKAAGSIIDNTTKAGGNEVTVQGVSFTLEDNKALLASARDKAYADAKAKAEQFAKLSGRALGPVEYVSETATPQRVTADQNLYKAAGAAAETATPVSPGEVTTNLDVSVRYSFG